MKPSSQYNVGPKPIKSKNKKKVKMASLLEIAGDGTDTRTVENKWQALTLKKI